MKILIASDRYKEAPNGVELMVLTLSDALIQLGHDVRILSMSPSRESQKADDNAFLLPSFPVFLYPGYRQSLVRNHPYLEELKNWKPDIVHTHTEGSAARMARFIAKETGAPYIMTMHTDYVKYGLHSFSDTLFARAIATPLCAFFLRSARVVITPSQKAKEKLLSYHCKHPICVIPNGIRQECFHKDFTSEERRELLARYGIPEEKKVFVCVSRISPEKNIRELLKFFSEVIRKAPETHLMIAGDGPDMKKTRKYARKIGITENVTFTGMIDHDSELYKYYKSAIAFVSASTFETFGLTNLEALCCGLPLICRNDPCLEGMLTNGVNGFTFDTADEFVNAGLCLLQDSELQQKMAAVSTERAKLFNEKKYAQQNMKLYEKVLSQKS
jgi:1,2-diacylglycerol 3-alpha-glucosyltransferase